MTWVWVDSRGYLVAHSESDEDARRYPGAEEVSEEVYRAMARIARERTAKAYAWRVEESQK